MNAVEIDFDRLAQVTELARGSHGNGSASMCAMEAAAFIAREPWSDHPECVCRVIGAFMRSWNDALPDEDRTLLLLPLIQKTLGTRGSSDLANRRAAMAADWLIRVHTPAWLRLAGLTAQADALAGLPEITDFAKTPGLLPTLEAVRKDADAAGAAAWDAAWAAAGAAAWDAAWAAAGAAAWDAAWVAARDAAWAPAWAAAGAAAWDAAWVAARDAAWVAARDAAWAPAWAAAGAAARDAAWVAARDAAWDAAWVAARDAAWDAATQKLAATRAELQQSAVALVDRMCALTDADLSIAA